MVGLMPTIYTLLYADILNLLVNYLKELACALITPLNHLRYFFIEIKNFALFSRTDIYDSSCFCAHFEILTIFVVLKLRFKIRCYEL
jgi:hypothetical protein